MIQCSPFTVDKGSEPERMSSQQAWKHENLRLKTLDSIISAFPKPFFLLYLLPWSWVHTHNRVEETKVTSLDKVAVNKMAPLRGFDVQLEVQVDSYLVTTDYLT
jgi:hypothetical protein